MKGLSRYQQLAQCELINNQRRSCINTRTLIEFELRLESTDGLQKDCGLLEDGPRFLPRMERHFHLDSDVGQSSGR